MIDVLSTYESGLPATITTAPPLVIVERADKNNLPQPKRPSYFPSAPAYTGKRVTADTSLQVIAVFACIRAIAEDIAASSIEMMKLTAKGKRPATEHTLYPILMDEPNSEQNAMEFIEMMVGHCLLRGNAYAQVVRDQTGAVLELIPLHPDRVYIQRNLTTGKLEYYYTPFAAGPQVIFKDTEIWHLRGRSDDGVYGLNPIQLAMQALGLALAEEEHAARVFGNGARPSGVFEYPGEVSDEMRDNILESFEERYVGLENAHKPMILEEGMKWHQMQLDNQQTQFLESRNFSELQIARLFRVPPHKIGLLDRATFSNIEQQNIEYVLNTLRPWRVRLVKGFRRRLLKETEKKKYTFVIDLDELLMGDYKSRQEGHAIGVDRGWLNRNEVREMEQWNPMEDPLGDEYIPAANLAGGKDNQASQQEDPAPKDKNADKNPDQKREEPDLPHPEALTKRETKFDYERLAESFRGLYEDAYSRVLRAENKQLSSTFERFIAENKVKEAQNWLTDFYVDHKTHFAKVILPTVRAIIGSVGNDVATAQIAAEYIADREILRHRADLSDLLRIHSVKEQVTELGSLRARWENSATQVAQDVVTSLMLKGEDRHAS